MSIDDKIQSTSESTDAKPQGRSVRNRAAGAPLISRRSLCVGTGGVAVLLALGAVNVLPKNPGLRPPGGQDLERLLSSCIRCQKCVEICPQKVIKPAHLEDGLLEMRMPSMDFSQRWCDWCEETDEKSPLCVKVCPTEALRLPAGSTPQNTVIGEARLYTQWCLAYRLIGCRSCYDACPYEAMGLDAEGRPYVISEKCNGCGACEAACISLQSGSIDSGATSRAIVVNPV